MKVIQISERTIEGREISGWLVIDASGYRVRYDAGYELRRGERLESGYVLPTADALEAITEYKDLKQEK